ncbi:putative limonene-1,2-epoxide hydrolase [Mycobacterium xenopi 4042]|uniref:Putative limonene-1,2-epoxide hydrolase n=1 Tax=Mycobacterium xenopi 4042 TaxID=1299334 RepID=X8BG90_MYCXE|nr:putative limonene-1,2-epoxide hydrolase [Mycobacterium xenopi 4042]
MLPFVSVHRVVDGKVTLWKDYWDFGAIANHARRPGWKTCRKPTRRGCSTRPG